MKMGRLMALAMATLILSSMCTVVAQQRVASNSDAKRVLTARTEINSTIAGEANVGSAETRESQISLLLKRKSALRKYLLSINPDSPDYRATENAIREIDLKLIELNKGAQKEVSTASIALTSTLGVPVAGSRASTTEPTMPQPQDFKPGKSLNDFLAEKIKAKIDQTSNSKQTETTSVSGNTTALVDQSSASDLIGVAMNLAGLSFKSNDEDKSETDSMSVTASAYSLYAALRGVKPLNPIFYNQNRGWRRVFLTLGFDNEKAEGTETTDRAKIVGVKVLLWDKRDPNDKDYAKGEISFDTLRTQMTAANVQFGQLYRRIIIYLFTENATTKELIEREFRQYLQTEREAALRAQSAATTDDERRAAQRRLDALDAATTRFNAGEAFKFGLNGRLVESTTRPEVEYFGRFQNERLLGAGLDQSVLDDINKFVEDELNGGLEQFARLNDTARKLIERIRTAPQLSFSVVTKQRDKGNDDYTSQVIFDYGLADRVNLTLNGNFNYVDSNVIGGDTRGGTFAGQLQFRFNKQPESITGKKPIYFYLATNNSWMVNAKPVYSGQAKLTIPLVDGFEIPLSFVVASRTNASNKNIIKGQFAFTVDTARLLKGLLSK